MAGAFAVNRPFLQPLDFTRQFAAIDAAVATAAGSAAGPASGGDGAAGGILRYATRDESAAPSAKRSKR
jgi:hypothetical protein